MTLRSKRLRKEKREAQAKVVGDDIVVNMTPVSSAEIEAAKRAKLHTLFGSPPGRV